VCMCVCHVFICLTVSQLQDVDNIHVIQPLRNNSQ
jgi:hypothetical protein